ncbi:apolipoprotein D-like [Eurosta solidaginis]|uniref:apolipoprotein D-like n=1 Tax=Eurosta solidaginis TaxID=178769 RepID=UPI003531516F
MLKNQFAIAPLSILIFLTSSCLVAGQIKRSGSCRTDIKHLPKVDLKRLEGSWYLRTRYPYKNDHEYRCQKTDYTLAPNNEYIVEYSEIKEDDQSINFRTGRLIFLEDGQFKIKYDDVDDFSINYRILSIVYDQYVIIYACKNLPECNHEEYLWIYTRNHKLNTKDLIAYTAPLCEQNINPNLLQGTIQENCANYDTSVQQQRKKPRR